MIRVSILALGLSSLLASAVVSNAHATGNGGNNNGNGCRNRCGDTVTGGPVNNYSPNLDGRQYQKQYQNQKAYGGQGGAGGQGGHGGQGGTGGTAISHGGQGGTGGHGYGFGGNATGGNATGGDSRSSSSSSVHNAGNSRVRVGDQRNSQSMSYNEARDRLQAPNLYGNFAGGATSPCEGNTFGLGASGPGLGGLLQVPVSRQDCWNERRALTVKALGGSSAAAIAVLGGHDPITAVNTYGYEQASYRSPHRVYRASAGRRVAKRGKRARCAC